MARTFPDAATLRVVALCTLYLRTPSGSYIDDVAGMVVEFVPALSAAEQLAFADIVALARSGYDLTLTEYQALKPSLATMRTFQQQTQAEFIALTQNARDRALFDLGNAHTKVLRALLRD